MKAYKVVLEEDGAVLATRYAGSQAEVREHKGRLAKQFGIGPRSKGLTSEEVEVPTGKAELLEFVNAVAALADQLEKSP